MPASYVLSSLVLSPNLSKTKKVKQFQFFYRDLPRFSSNWKKGGLKRADQNTVFWELNFAQTRWGKWKERNYLVISN